VRTIGIFEYYDEALDSWHRAMSTANNPRLFIVGGHGVPDGAIMYWDIAGQWRAVELRSLVAEIKGARGVASCDFIYTHTCYSANSVVGEPLAKILARETGKSVIGANGIATFHDGQFHTAYREFVGVGTPPARVMMPNATSYRLFTPNWIDVPVSRSSFNTFAVGGADKLYINEAAMRRAIARFEGGGRIGFGGAAHVVGVNAALLAIDVAVAMHQYADDLNAASSIAYGHAMAPETRRMYNDPQIAHYAKYKAPTRAILPAVSATLEHVVRARTAERAAGTQAQQAYNLLTTGVVPEPPRHYYYGARSLYEMYPPRP
jgi:hypothetical protein